VPAAFRDSLLEQSDNWTRGRAAAQKPERRRTTTAAKADEKEGDMANTGLGSQLGAEEGERWGTAVTVDKFFKYESETFALDRLRRPGRPAGGRTFAPQNLTKATTRTAGGGFRCTCPTSCSGSPSTRWSPGRSRPCSRPSTIAYLSTFNVGASMPDKSATIQVNKPFDQRRRQGLHVPRERARQRAAFSMAVGGVLMSTWNWLSKDETTPARPRRARRSRPRPTPQRRRVVAPVDTTLTYAGRRRRGRHGRDLTWTQPFAEGRFFLDGSGTRARPIPNGLATVTGTLNGEFYDSTVLRAFRSGAFARSC
jgi:hypothetical protein